jgi:hypothetical protein
MKFLDFGYSFDQYFNGEQRGEIDCNVLACTDNCDYESGEAHPFEEDERDIVKRDIEGILFEQVNDDTLYNNILSQIIKVLESMNQDERSAFFKSQYI